MRIEMAGTVIVGGNGDAHAVADRSHLSVICPQEKGGQ